METFPDTRFFFCDEVLFQLSTHTTHTWAQKGERPIVKTNGSHEKLIQIGAVEPATQERFHLLVPFTTQETFGVFRCEFAKTFDEGKSVLIKDGASWHWVQSPCEPLERWTLPPDSPELNPK